MRFRFCKRTLLPCSVTGLVVIVLWVLLRPSPCEEVLLNNVCHAWKKGEVDGDWCSQLCEQTTEKSCHNLIHYGKRVVVRLRGPFGKAVAKSRFLTWTTPKEIVPPLRPSDPTGDFQNRARLFVENIYTIKDERLLWNRISIFSLSPQQRSHLLQLLEQREFVWSYLFTQERSPFPRVRGTCAHIFIVEEADIELGQVNSWPLEDRLRVALKLIDLVIALERLKVQMCDLKWEHFGIGLNLTITSSVYSSDGSVSETRPARLPTEVKLLDLDAVFSEASLKLNMDRTPCENDQDCDYFDCKGQCVQRDLINDSKPMCVSSRWDSNLRRLLLMLSGSLFPPQMSFFRELGSDAPLVHYIADRCLNDAFYDSMTIQSQHCDPHLLKKHILEALQEERQKHS